MVVIVVRAVLQQVGLVCVDPLLSVLCPPQLLGSRSGTEGFRDGKRALSLERREKHQPSCVSSSPAGWERVPLPTRGCGFAGQVCVSRPARDHSAMGRYKKEPRGDKGKGKGGKPSHRRDPQKNWWDLEYLACQMLRHGRSRSCRGTHDLRGRLRQNGWTTLDEASAALGVTPDDLRQVVAWQRRDKVRVEIEEGWIRALQGHTPDSGLGAEDFHEPVDLPAETVVAHGTHKERIPSILEKGLIASGGGSHEGRLFVHWSTEMFSRGGKHTGVRSGSDAVVVTTVGDLAGINMVKGKEGVVLTGDVPSNRFLRISTYDEEEGTEGELLWSRGEGLAPPSGLPTSDSESSLEIEVIGRPSSSSVARPAVKEEKEGEASDPEREASSPSEESEEEVKEGVEEEARPKELDPPLALDDPRRRSEVRHAYVQKGLSEWSAAPTGAHYPDRADRAALKAKELGAEFDFLYPPPGQEVVHAKVEAIEGKAQNKVAPAPEVKPEEEGSATKEEEGEPRHESRAGAVSSQPSRGRDRGPRAKSFGPSEKQKEKEYDRSRGEIPPTELQEIWSKKPRYTGQRAVEHYLRSAADRELRWQEQAQEGFSNLVSKEAAAPTSGGRDRLESQLRAITVAASSSTALRKRAGRGDEVKNESHYYGKAITEEVPEAKARLEAAEAVEPKATERDSRYEAGIRAGVSARLLKKQARSRKRAAGHRVGERTTLTGARLERERGAPGDDPPGWAHPPPQWDVDDGLDELTYPEGTWICKLCQSANPPDKEQCEGWVKGSACVGTYSEDWASWAPTKAVPKKTGQKKAHTRLEEELQKDAWWCPRCKSGNLCYRVKCYKCSRERPAAKEESSASDDDYGPKRTAATERAAEEFLKKKQEMGLRRHRKRGGAKHKKHSKKKKSAGLPAAGPAVRGSGAVSSKRKKAEVPEAEPSRAKVRGRKKLRRQKVSWKAPRERRSRKKTKRTSRWSKSRKSRNKAAHSDHGNGLGVKQVLAAVSCLVALPVIRETDEVIGTASEAVQEIILEGGQQIRETMTTVSVTCQVITVWFLAMWILNWMQRCSNGNTAATSKAKLVLLDGNTSVWMVGSYKVRFTQSTSSCVCRGFLRNGKCEHVGEAKAALRSLGVLATPALEDRSSPARPSVLDRGRAAMAAPTKGLGLGSCFQGLVEKAKAMNPAKASGERTEEETKTLIAILDQEAAKVRESLSLDSHREDSAVAAVSSRRGASLSGSGDPCRAVHLHDGEFFGWVLQQLEHLGRNGRALVRAYSLDQPAVVQAIKAASERGCMAMVVADKSQARGKTKMQLQALKELQAGGVRVRLLEGLSVNSAYQGDGRSTRTGKKLLGLHHSKSLFLQFNTQEPVVWITYGSCNFTTSSKANRETSVALELSERSGTALQWVASFEECFRDGSTISDFEGPAASATVTAEAQ